MIGQVARQPELVLIDAGHGRYRGGADEVEVGPPLRLDPRLADG